MATEGILKKPADQIRRKMVMKGQVVQIGQIPLQSKEEMPFIQSKHPPSTVTMKEILRSAKFVPVLVFIPAPIEGDQVSLLKSLGKDSLAHIVGGRLSEVLKKGDGTPNATNEKATVAFGDVTVDFLRMEAFRKKEPVALTTLEFKTLKYLTRNTGRVISRDELLSEVWGYEHYPTTRTVDNTILKLRQKLEPKPSRPAHFRTIYGTGYKFLP
jgi:DNA-binding response OmpR family regulator